MSTERDPSASPRFELDERDRALLRERGIAEQELRRQLACFVRGFPALRLDRPAVLGDGIEVVTEEDDERLMEHWRGAALAGRLGRFTPASGAASRMFKALAARRADPVPLDDEALAALRASGNAAGRDVARFFDEIEHFAFFDDLRAALRSRGLDLAALLQRGDRRPVLEVLLDPDAMGAAELPKGLLPFHRYEGRARTAFEEQLHEARDTVTDGEGICRVHFTVPPDHREQVVAHLESVAARLEGSPAGPAARPLRFDLQYSEQSPATDTVAVDLRDRPLRDEDGQLVFRPGGHGALLHNLREMAESGGDVVLVKNIDNVTTDERREDTLRWKRRLAGLLVERESEQRRWRARLGDTEPATAEVVAGARRFVRTRLQRGEPNAHSSRPDDHPEVLAWLRDVLARPLRVCGMVRNEGEPGGGPFWVRAEDGGLSLQIVESSQVDHDDPVQEEVFRASTHFNPVDLVCTLRDSEGRLHDLDRFVDPETGFIAKKSKDGQELKALERPGLWNGAMAHWNTIFVEVPLSTFSPVKTVLDLLRPPHQPPGAGEG